MQIFTSLVSFFHVYPMEISASPLYNDNIQYSYEETKNAQKDAWEVMYQSIFLNKNKNMLQIYCKGYFNYFARF